MICESGYFKYIFTASNLIMNKYTETLWFYYFIR